MTLTDALRTATTSLMGNAQQLAVTSRNISGVGDENYVRREASVTTGLLGTTKIEVQRAVNWSLYSSTLHSSAASSRTDVVFAGLDTLATHQEIDSFSYSSLGVLTDLKKSVELAAASPADPAVLESLIASANVMALSLNRFQGEVQSLRADADRNISAGVSNVNMLLIQIGEVNDKIVSGTRLAQDVLDQIDRREQLIKDLSAEIGIKTLRREDNDVVLLTESGLIMFEGEPRTVTFQPTPSFNPGDSLGELRIDGVPVTGPNASMRISSGKLTGHFELRDVHVVQQQMQLDEIARGLVETFAEYDSAATPTKPPLTGLFTWDGGPSIPTAGTLSTGIALSIRVNPLVDPGAGGNAFLVRDGGINGDPDYISNPGGANSFSDLLFQLSDKLDQSVSFDPQAGLPDSMSILDYAAQSLNWLNSARQSAQQDANYNSELANQFATAFQNESGPNLDVEMSKLLELERTYQATAKIIAAVDNMFALLMQSIGR